MIISLNWLNEYVDVKDFFDKPEKLAEILTKAGLEVEGIVNQAKAFDNVVIGEIIEKGQHPNADRLTLCKVNVDSHEPLQIVCGAKNHQKGDKVVVAKVGAILPGDFAIKKSKIRSVESFGMLCSDKELGLSDESEGIKILDPDAPVGKSFGEHFDLNKVVFELKVTPNRADCLSHFGLAREVGCLLDRKVKYPEVTFNESKDSTKDKVTLEVKDTELCPRYCGRYIQDVKVSESPNWLKKHLESVGLNTINNVVDITNFVMMELGQPLHAFDVRYLIGNKVLVDRSAEGETFTTLDGTEVKLTGMELMIRDTEKPVALAGVVGGLNSGIQDDTQDVFLESAYFNPSGVRKSSRRHGIETDSAYRFSRGVDPDSVRLAMDRAAQLIQDLAGGTVFKDPHDFYPNPVERPIINVSAGYVSDRMGAPVSEDSFENVLRRIGCEIKNKSGAEFEVYPPSYRVDLSLNVDLVEEYGRLIGYDEIGETQTPVSVAPTPSAREYLLEKEVSLISRQQGFQEAKNFSFIDPKFQSEFIGSIEILEQSGLITANEPVKILNPISEDLSVMRTSLLPWLAKNAAHGSHYGSSNGSLFETGKSFAKEGDGFKEYWRVGYVKWGRSQGLWTQSNYPLVLELKSRIEEILKGLGLSRWDWQNVEVAPDFLHPFQSARLFFEGKFCGVVGTLHPKYNEIYKIREEVALAELDLDHLLCNLPKISRAKSISKYPKVERDLAFVIPKDLAVSKVMKEMKKAGGEKVQDLRVFDVFEGGNLKPDQRSVAFRLVIQDFKGTMTDEELQKLQSTIIDATCSNLSIQVR